MAVREEVAPVDSRREPKMRNTMITVAETARETPRMPSVLRNMWVTILSKV